MVAPSGGCSSSNISPVVLQSQSGPCGASPPLDAFFLSGSSPSFLGSRSMVSFEDVHSENGLIRPFFRTFDKDDNGEDDLDEYLHQPGKKRRLTINQVQFLEKSFEVDNKLEPERKIQLAKDLVLQPRQVAIWFQNRRARWKTKQLEKDYEALQATYNNLKTDYDDLLKEKEKLQTEIDLLKDKLLLNENGCSKLSGKDNFSFEPPKRSNFDTASEGEVSKTSIAACKQEDISSGKSDIFDSDSPHYTDGVHSSLLETGDSSYVFEQDQSDLSQDEDDNLSKSLMPPCIFPKLENADYTDPPASFDDNAFWSWSIKQKVVETVGSGSGSGSIETVELHSASKRRS